MLPKRRTYSHCFSLPCRIFLCTTLFPQFVSNCNDLIRVQLLACYTSRVVNSVDADQLASEKPADLD